MTKKKDNLKTASFAAGCFWGIEHKFKKLTGVVETEVGYSGGDKKNPTYKQVCSGKTGHAETVRIKYDPEIISYKELVEFFWKIHDPTQKNRQGPDIGTQYRSVIFYHNKNQKEIAERSKKEFEKKRKIATEVVPAKEFYKAEDYHQDYYG
ncbi:peptide-methionine (S)-S-oxide reductase MsrA [Candidatus Woesearchaeota archaeon]|nr:peptide-methionine (S)-S-oxide reductase MsrA [Candidatus Woesearchaeota archaeon]